jgi:hypothetical protein
MENFKEKIKQLINIDNGWYSHREFLVIELDKLDFEKKINILEFGTGHGSAEIFYEYTKKYPNLNIIAFDSDIKWVESMSKIYTLPNYTFNFVENWDSMLDSYEFLDTYDLVFIDQSPWEARINTLNKLKQNSKVLILHDYDYYNKKVYCNDCTTENIYDIGEGTFFDRYNNELTLINHYSKTLNNVEHPPTLVMYKKDI